MEMDKLIFLGTAGDVDAMAKQRRGTGGIVLQLGGSQLHLDPGPGSLVRAKMAGVSARDTIAVLATNGSLLRCNDVNAVISAMTLDGMDKHGVLLAGRNVIETRVFQQSKSFLEGIVPLAVQSKVGVNEVMVVPVKTNGKDLDGLGLLISSHNILIGYTGDTAWYETMASDYEGVDVLVVNVANPSDVKEEGVMNVADAERLVAGVKPKAAFLTGFGSKLLDQDVMDVARQVQRASKADTTAASDGLVVELDAFAKRA